jgi:hypothetical protein
MIKGFQLRVLRATGAGKKPAEVRFGPGFNVISGASNTGKSYILQCIDFMLGGSTRPKRIDESAGYESLFLEIEDYNHQVHQLERSLSGHGFVHRILSNGSSLSEENLSEKHSPTDKATVSAFLLESCDAWGRRIRLNQSGKTRVLGFRDLSWLSLVDEMRIISDTSPVLTGQYTTRTEELSIFKLLLTGIDDSSVIATESRKESRARQKAQLELLDRLIPQLEAEISDLDKEPASIEERRKRTEAAIATKTEILTANQDEIAQHEQTRQEAWSKTQQLELRQASTTELRRRFAFLEEHYKNDLARLQAIIEMDSYFSQLQQVRCPLCGAPPDDHDPSVHEGQPVVYLENIRQACRAEIAKIQGLLRDLIGTTSQLDTEISEIQQQYETQSQLYQSTTQEIMIRLAPAARQNRLELTEVINVRDRLAQAATLHSKLVGLQEERNKIASYVWKAEPRENASDILMSQSVETFVLKVQSILEAWKYPGLTRVTFSDEKVDLVISGKERSSEGKGFRAIAYAAFIIGLLDYCTDSTSELSHPGLVVLDSPLVTYKRRDTSPGEEISDDVIAAFYEALSMLPKERQVIVLENNDPPAHLIDRINYTHFSRSATGRYGFFPVT